VVSADLISAGKVKEHLSSGQMVIDLLLGGIPVTARREGRACIWPGGGRSVGVKKDWLVVPARGARDE
jgi:hypothetical protein